MLIVFLVKSCHNFFWDTLYIPIALSTRSMRTKAALGTLAAAILTAVAVTTTVA